MCTSTSSRRLSPVAPSAVAGGSWAKPSWHARLVGYDGSHNNGLHDSCHSRFARILPVWIFRGLARRRPRCGVRRVGSRSRPEGRPRRAACPVYQLLAGRRPSAIFGRLDELPRRYLESVLASRPDLHDAVVARHRYAGHLAGLASLATGSDMGPEIAELGVLVVDAWQRQGLGTAMVEALVARGRQRGVQRVSACVLPDRARVLAALARRLQPERIVRTPHCLTGVYRLDAG
ncbi:MAG TPA: GNAT family N-acetyltransferase [Pseudonocardia sp.]|uniref:GNAT family N-acetyltransferase n=1 Tax=Pseudonocardia sp. TaxID=60912 RepID=UPI002ED8E1A8